MLTMFGAARCGSARVMDESGPRLPHQTWSLAAKEYATHAEISETKSTAFAYFIMNKI